MHSPTHHLGCVFFASATLLALNSLTTASGLVPTEPRARAERPSVSSLAFDDYEIGKELKAGLAGLDPDLREMFDAEAQFIVSEYSISAIEERASMWRQSANELGPDRNGIMLLLIREANWKISQIKAGELPEPKSASSSRAPKLEDDGKPIDLSTPDWRNSQAFKELGDDAELLPPSAWMRSLEFANQFPYQWQRAALLEEQNSIISLLKVLKLDPNAKTFGSPQTATLAYTALRFDERLHNLDRALTQGQTGPSSTPIVVEGALLPRNVGVGALKFGPIPEWAPTTTQIRAGELTLDRLPKVCPGLNIALQTYLGETTLKNLGLSESATFTYDPDRVAIFTSTRKSQSGSTMTTALVIDGCLVQASYRVTNVTDRELAPKIGASVLERYSEEFGEPIFRGKLVPNETGTIAMGVAEWKVEGARVWAGVAGEPAMNFGSTYKYEVDKWVIEPVWIGLASPEVRRLAGTVQSDPALPPNFVLLFARATPKPGAANTPPLPKLKTADGSILAAVPGGAETAMAYGFLTSTQNLQDGPSPEDGDAQFPAPALKWAKEQRIFNPFDEKMRRQSDFFKNFRDDAEVGLILAYGPVDPEWTEAELQFGSTRIAMNVGKMGRMPATTVKLQEAKGPISSMLNLSAAEGKLVRLGLENSVYVESAQFGEKISALRAAKDARERAAKDTREAKDAKAAAEEAAAKKKRTDDLLR